MNLGGGYAFLQEKELQNVGSWIPLTPEKPVQTRSNPINVDSEGDLLGRVNWQQLLGLPIGHTRDISNYHTGAQNYNANLQIGQNECQNFNPNSFLGLLAGSCPWDDTALAEQNQMIITGNGGMSWNDNSLAGVFQMENAASSFMAQHVTPDNGIHATSRPLMLDLNAQMDENWAEHNTASMSIRNQSYSQNSKLWSTASMPQDGFPVPPYGPNYNLNSPPRTLAKSTTAITNCFPFAALAPDQVRSSQNSCLSEIFNHSVVESASHGRDRHDEAVVISVENGNFQPHFDELLQSIVESSAVDRTPIKETNNNKESDRGIDLNKTPPQKPPKRRKHRPKVVIEGKPKRTPKPAVRPNTNPKEKPAGKRKYVRKNGLKASKIKPADVKGDVIDPTVGNATKSCRRMLNFDLEKTSDCHIDDQQDQRQNGGKRDFNLNLDYEATTTCDRTSNVFGTKSVPQNVLSVNNQHAETACSISHSTDHMPDRNLSLPKRYPLSATVTTLKDSRMENLNVESTTNNQSSDPKQRSWDDGCSPVQYKNTEGIDSRAKNSLGYLERSGQLMLQKSNQPVLEHVADLIEARRLKREHHRTLAQTHSNNLASTNSSLLCQQRFQINRYNNHDNNLLKDFSEPEKRRKTENGLCTNISSILAHVGSGEVTSKQFSANRGNNANANQIASTIDIDMSEGHFNSSSQSRHTNSTPPTADAHHFSKQQHLFELFSPGVAAEEKRSMQVQHFPSLTADVLLPPTPCKRECTLRDGQGNNNSLDKTLTTKQVEGAIVSNMLSSSTESDPVSGDRQVNDTHSAKTVTKKRGPKSAVSNLPSSGREKPEKTLDYQFLLLQEKGMPSKQMWSDLIDQITCQLTDLRLHDISMGIACQEQNAIVPYKADGTIVTYVSKKRKPRPKVDLDPETERIWKLLMGGEDDGGTKGTDKDKEQWWEEERKVFRGRADSFIARMHLVQGDRRFSQWKGSVVDSVIGVFLTQNVSDHLSSSAFMSLAARFPIKNASSRTCYKDDTGIIVEEPEVSEDQDGSAKCHGEVLGQQVFHIPRVEDPLYNESFREGHCQAKVVECNQTTQLMKTLDHLYGYSAFTSATNFSNSHGRVQTVLPSNYRLHVTPDPRVLETENLQVLHKDSTSWPFYACETIKVKGSECMSNRCEQIPQGSGDLAIKKNGSCRQQETPVLIPEVLASKPPLHEESSSRPGLNKETTQYSYNDQSHHETATFQKEGTSIPGPSEEKYSGNMHIKTNTKNSKERKIKHDGEKKNVIEWDSLRREAQSNRVRERNRATMDSMDYEAMRNANVNDISNAIKERGMNNMLADRIKDFLSRIVREHGSIDLEWLRDAPPDKVKEYLLSIRGLGLKSVECVRLLTLHHLAFPVDTNVGRIAVRLGWVPLQPLPESLQLHLLEMYPMLESIQKYLWPRLCKLDQRTLYELHYQMITFGKVFCTKSKPNCNACPMRGECRHFASAFASTRLALPGPEEKGIVTSNVPTTAEINNSFQTNPMLLPPSENILTSGERSKGMCEPIIEEPASPEPERIEITESDIEDAFWEDPDEIPTIKLNIEDFTQNLQNYIQENNFEVQDGDMSKALVALNPAAASIPTQKLKNVSRLRTEHQVYELPDSHLLLKGLERREPDDPSPYLLAIWTPGETANSTQAPESQCGSQDSGKLCNEKTCFSCNSIREANSHTVRGTILIPCRTAMRGSFPLNGTYFQVNEMFADHDSSINPINIPRAWIWNLPRRTVFFGTSVSTIFKGLTTEQIQYCFWRGFVCVRGFDQKTRAPRPLMARLHFPVSRLVKTKDEKKRVGMEDAPKMTN